MIVVHVTHFKLVGSRTVVKQGHHLRVAPSALGAVGVQGLYLVEEGALGQQVVHRVELVGDTGNCALTCVTFINNSTQLGRLILASIDLNPLQLGIIAVGKELNLLTFAAI